MTKSHPELVARLATSNISTEDFSYLTTYLMESRTCENCFYYEKDTPTFGEYEAPCSNMIIEEKDLFTVRHDFGCNKFEKIEL